MSLWSRIANAFRSESLNREIDSELESHLEEARAAGRDLQEVRRAFGSPLRHREQIRDAKLLPWLDSLGADSSFAVRQLKKHKVTSVAAILSLALAIGSCTSAFRIIDAILLRPIPIKNPQNLYATSREGINFSNEFSNFDGSAYPMFQQLRAAVSDQAELIAISYSERMDLAFSSDQAVEKAHIQYVSGNMFAAFGLNPAVGRLFTDSDNLHPRAHPYAVISYDFWSQRFHRDPQVIGKTFHLGDTIFEIIGVSEKDFTGTEPGTVIDIFLPTMMHPSVTRDDSTWHRTFVIVKPGVPREPLRAKLEANSQAFERNRAKSFVGMPQQALENFLNQREVLEPAPQGVSGLQHDNRPALAALAILVSLVLLIACANVANLMTAQASARGREMALRISIGAGRARLIQMVLIESAWVATLAAVIGTLFAAWSAPFVVSLINPPDNPARLILPADGRVLGFGIALTVLVTCVFGLFPALRASAINPSSELKGGDDPHSRRRVMHTLVALQVAFCFLVLFVAGLFVTTFHRLAHLSVGFNPDRLLVLSTATPSPQLAIVWQQIADHLRSVPGVQKSALCDSALLGGNSSNDYISISGGRPIEVLAYFRKISPGWLDEMQIPLLSGRDFLPSDSGPSVAIVNETFAKTYFSGQNPVGKTFERAADEVVVVGLVHDASYRSIRELHLPTVFIPFWQNRSDSEPKLIGDATFIVRTAGDNPLSLAQALRAEVPNARSEFRVSDIRTQLELVQDQTVRERLLATLAFFFAAVALLLASIGLYGVLNYSVLERRREIGIRMAVGAQATDIVRRVTADIFLAILGGAAAGLILGIISARSLQSLFYQVKPTDLAMLALPSLTILAAAALASLPAVLNAVRTDPVQILRTD